MRKIVGIGLVVLMGGVAFGNVPDNAMVKVPSALPLFSGLETINWMPVASSSFTTSPGEQMGITYYDYQQNGTIGTRVWADVNGYVHNDWMWSPNPSFNPRQCYYNVYIDGAFIWPDGVPVSGLYREGYVTLGCLPDGRAVCAFHHAPGDLIRAAVAVDAYPGAGAFTVTDVDPVTIPPGPAAPIWPHIAVGPTGVIHVLAYEQVPGAGASADFDYARSTDEGETFSTWMPLAGDTVMACLSGDIATSKTSGRVGIAYTRDLPELHAQFAQNLWLRESEDHGATWGENAQITDYPVPSPDDYANDIWRLSAYTDCDLLYDHEDNPHIVYTEKYSSYDGSGFYRLWHGSSRIVHWSEATGFSVLSGTAPIPDTTKGIDTLKLWGTAFGIEYDGWRFPCDRPQLAIDDDGVLYCVWTGNRDTTDISGGGRINGELYASVSTDNGATWGIKGVPDSVFNLTNSQSPGASPGYCEDDDYHSLYPYVYNDSLHIQYINDKDAGGIPQQEGLATENPVLYLKVATADLLGGVAMSLITPNGGEIWYQDSTYNIEWLASGEVELIDHIRLTLSTNGGVSYDSVIVNSTENDGVYAWTVPNTIESNECRVKAEAMDAEDNILAWDASDANLEIKEWKGIAEPGVPTPASFEVYPAQPNPFSISTTLSYAIPTSGRVSLKVYDVAGALVRTLVATDFQSPGTYSVRWDGRADDGGLVPSGVYFLRFDAAGSSHNQKLLMVR